MGRLRAMVQGTRERLLDARLEDLVADTDRVKLASMCRATRRRDCACAVPMADRCPCTPR